MGGGVVEQGQEYPTGLVTFPNSLAWEGGGGGGVLVSVTDNKPSQSAVREAVIS